MSKEIIWKGFKIKPRKKPVRKEVWWGWDSEAYTTSGQPFLFCAVSEKRLQLASSDPLDLLAQILLATERDAKPIIWVWNLDYEIGAIIRALHLSLSRLPVKQWRRIRRGIWLKILPHKYLGIRMGRRTIHFYDGYNFYQMPLEKAASKMSLSLHKLPINTEEFRPELVNKIYDNIKQYCLVDAEITLELMLRLRKAAQALNFHPQVHYSPAAWAVEYFRSHTAVENVRLLWAHDWGKELIQLALQAYKGGKFEMTTLGTVPYAYLYDLNSAYPAVIRTLYQIEGAKIIKSTMEPAKYDYAFIECIIHIPPEQYVPHPVGIRRKGVLVFPAGIFHAVITADEYHFLKRANIEIKILRAFWIQTTQTPIYEAAVDQLYRAKQEHSDHCVRELAKIIMNSFYGKMIQSITTETTIEPGMCWHPIHAAIVTARVRCWVSELQKEYGDHILAVHTDSVISDCPLPLPTSGIGQWRLQQTGEYIGIKEGMYQVGKKVASRGIVGIVDWYHFLRMQPPGATTFSIPQRHLITWREARLRRMPIECINTFVNLSLTFSPNTEPRKRWFQFPITVEQLFMRIPTYPLVLFLFPTAKGGSNEVSVVRTGAGIQPRMETP